MTKKEKQILRRMLNSLEEQRKTIYKRYIEDADNNRCEEWVDALIEIRDKTDVRFKIF